MCIEPTNAVAFTGTAVAPNSEASQLRQLFTILLNCDPSKNHYFNALELHSIYLLKFLVRVCKTYNHYPEDMTYNYYSTVLYGTLCIIYDIILAKFNYFFFQLKLYFFFQVMLYTSNILRFY